MRIFSEIEPGATGSASSGEQQLDRIRQNLALVRSIVAIASAKGGVGKSTLTVNIAAALALAGRKVGIVDADLNSPSIMEMLGIKPVRRWRHQEEGIEPVAGPLGLRIAGAHLIADGDPPPVSFLEQEAPVSANGAGAVELSYTGTLRRLLGETRFGSLDLLLIDLAPGLEQVHRLSKIVALSGIILGAQPSELSARAAMDLLDLATHLSARTLGIVENMVGFSCDGCHSVRPLIPQAGSARIVRDSGAPVLARLPFDPRLAESCDRGTLFVRDYPDTPLARQLTGLAQGIVRKLAGRESPSLPPV